MAFTCTYEWLVLHAGVITHVFLIIVQYRPRPIIWISIHFNNDLWCLVGIRRSERIGKVCFKVEGNYCSLQCEAVANKSYFLTATGREADWIHQYMCSIGNVFSKYPCTFVSVHWWGICCSLHLLSRDLLALLAQGWCIIKQWIYINMGRGRETE